MIALHCFPHACVILRVSPSFVLLTCVCNDDSNDHAPVLRIPGLGWSDKNGDGEGELVFEDSDWGGDSDGEVRGLWAAVRLCLCLCLFESEWML